MTEAGKRDHRRDEGHDTWDEASKELWESVLQYLPLFAFLISYEI